MASAARGRRDGGGGDGRKERDRLGFWEKRTGRLYGGGKSGEEALAGGGHRAHAMCVLLWYGRGRKRQGWVCWAEGGLELGLAQLGQAPLFFFKPEHFSFSSFCFLFIENKILGILY